MLKATYFPGVTVQVTPHGRWQRDFSTHKDHWFIPTPFDAKVIFVVDGVPGVHVDGLICEGVNSQESMASWIQELCKQAGIAPEQRVQWVSMFDLPENFDPKSYLGSEFLPEFLKR